MFRPNLSTSLMALVFLIFDFSKAAFANNAGEADPCISTDATLGDSAFWAVRAVEQFASQDSEAAVATVDACFDRWGPEAGHQQKRMHDAGKRCPKTGRVSAKARAKIEANYLINDVALALWAKARALDELGRKDEVIGAYSQCVYMTCGRAWDPKGWFWSPAEDCAEHVKKLL